MGAGGLDLRRAGRVALVDHIGAVLAIPHSGCDGQARLFDGAELRLRWPLGRARILWPKDQELRGNWGRGERFGNRAEPGTGSAVLSTVLRDLRQLAQKALRASDAGESPSRGCRNGIAGVPCAGATARPRLPLTLGDW